MSSDQSNVNTDNVTQDFTSLVITLDDINFNTTSYDSNVDTYILESLYIYVMNFLDIKQYKIYDFKDFIHFILIYYLKKLKKQDISIFTHNLTNKYLIQLKNNEIDNEQILIGQAGGSGSQNINTYYFNILNNIFFYDENNKSLIKNVYEHYSYVFDIHEKKIEIDKSIIKKYDNGIVSYKITKIDNKECSDIFISTKYTEIFKIKKDDDTIIKTYTKNDDISKLCD